MSLLSRSLLLAIALLSSATAGRSQETSSFLSRCRMLYSNWDTEVTAAKGVGLSEPARGARMLDAIQREAGQCLLALQNDLSVLERVSDIWEIEPPLENVRTMTATERAQEQQRQIQSVQTRTEQVQRNLKRFGTPQWDRNVTLGGEAIGSHVDFNSTRQYIQDASAVVKKWSELAPRFAPVLEGLVSQLKPRVGLAVDARECRALWLLRNDDPSVAVSQTELPPATRIGFCVEALRNDLEVLDKYLRSLPTQPRSVNAGDIKSWVEPTLHGAAIGSVQSIEIEIDKYLIDSHLVHKSKNSIWLKAKQKLAPGLGDIVHSVMSLRGLRELISLLFTSEVALLDMRRDGDSSVFVPEDAKAKTFPTASLLIESEHFGAGRSPYFHSSFGGTLAALPVVDLLKQQPPAEGTSDKEKTDEIFPTFQQAFVWDLNGRVHSNLRGRLEVSALGFYGQSILLDDKSLVERDEDFVGVALNNEAGRGEFFWGWMAEARVFDLDLDIIHGEHSYLNPRFSIGFGQRWNNRLVPETDSMIPHNQWKRSNLFRFRWNIRNSLVSRDKFQKPLLVTFSFGVEREWWPNNAGLPTTTTVFFSGDFDINKIIKKKE